MQSKTDLNTYIEAGILVKSKNFTALQAREYLNKKSQAILDNNNFDFTKESEKIKFLNEIRNNSINTISENKIIFLQLILPNYFHSMLLNPRAGLFCC